MTIASGRAVIDAKLNQEKVTLAHSIQHGLPAILNKWRSLSVKIKQTLAVCAHRSLNEVHPGANAATAHRAIGYGHEIPEERSYRSSPASRARCIAISNGGVASDPNCDFVKRRASTGTASFD
jgi:hypothetical protein